MSSRRADTVKNDANPLASKNTGMLRDHQSEQLDHNEQRALSSSSRWSVDMAFTGIRNVTAKTLSLRRGTLGDNLMV